MPRPVLKNQQESTKLVKEEQASQEGGVHEQRRTQVRGSQTSENYGRRSGLLLPQPLHTHGGSAVITAPTSSWLFPSSLSLDPVKAPKLIGSDVACWPSSLSLFSSLCCPVEYRKPQPLMKNIQSLPPECGRPPETEGPAYSLDGTIPREPATWVFGR